MGGELLFGFFLRLAEEWGRGFPFSRPLERDGREDRGIFH